MRVLLPRFLFFLLMGACASASAALAQEVPEPGPSPFSPTLTAAPAELPTTGPGAVAGVLYLEPNPTALLDTRLYYHHQIVDCEHLKGKARVPRAVVALEGIPLPKAFDMKSRIQTHTFEHKSCGFPGMQIVWLGSSVVFKGHEHGILLFSPRVERIELKKGDTAGFKPGEAGPYKVHCEKHPNRPIGTIFVVDGPYHDTTDDSGRFLIPDVPQQAKLHVRVWHEMAEGQFFVGRMEPDIGRWLDLSLEEDPVHKIRLRAMVYMPLDAFDDPAEE